MSTPEEFRVTFGCRYAREQHPYLESAHPDGWVTVWAYDEISARRIAATALGMFWSAVYRVSAVGTDWSGYPLGELAVLNPQDMPARERHLRLIDEAIGLALNTSPGLADVLYDGVIRPLMAEAEMRGAVHGITPDGDRAAATGGT